MPWKNRSRWQELQQYVPAGESNANIPSAIRFSFSGGPEVQIDYRYLFQSPVDAPMTARAVTSSLVLGLRLQHLDEYKERVDFLRACFTRVANKEQLLSYGNTVAILSTNPAFAMITPEIVQSAFTESTGKGVPLSSASVDVDVLIDRLLSKNVFPAVIVNRWMLHACTCVGMVSRNYYVRCFQYVRSYFPTSHLTFNAFRKNHYFGRVRLDILRPLQQCVRKVLHWWCSLALRSQEWDRAVCLAVFASHSRAQEFP